MFCDRIQELLAADRLHPPFVAAMSNGTSANINNNDYSKTACRWICGSKNWNWLFANPHLRSSRMLKWCWPIPINVTSFRTNGTMQEKQWNDKRRPTRFRSFYSSIILQAVQIGDLGISAIPFEVFTETGLELKARNPFKTSFTMELANGGYGYLPTPEQHRLGGYETWLGTNRVEVQATVKIVDALLKMFTELAETPRS